MSTLPTSSYYGAVTPADVIQPIGKVLRLCSALVVAQTGDAVYPPAASTNLNDERGLGRLVVHQENMPYRVTVSNGSDQTVNLDASQAVAEKAIRSGVKFENALSAGVTFTLPNVDKFLALGCKLGDKGTMRVTASVLGAGSAVAIIFAGAGVSRLYGARYFGADVNLVQNLCGFVIHWKIEDIDGTAVPRMEYIITGDKMILPP